MKQFNKTTVINSVKEVMRNIMSPLWLLVGLLIYSVTRKTPAFAYQSMVHLFCITKGRSNDWLSILFGYIKMPYNFGKEADGILGNMSWDDKQGVVEDLRNKGYHVFASKLPDDLCDRLLEYALIQPCLSRPMDGEGKEKEKYGVYPRSSPEVARYDFTTQDLLRNKDIQGLLIDMSFPAVASEYLGARAIVDVLSMWWHTSFSNTPDMKAAQYYHFDMDRPKWLKFFIYLTDVTINTGAHMFVEWSQKTNGIPSSMLKKGYARLTDEEVEEYYGKEKIIEFIAPRGTIIAEDTRGLHKWKHVHKDDRLILQIQFSNSMFGGDYPDSRFETNVEEKLQEKMTKYPDLYASYIQK